MSDGTDVSVGDSEYATLGVAPADNTTLAVLTVRKPDGSSSTATASGGTLVPVPDTSPAANSQQWTTSQPVVYDQPGRWVLHWTVTGTGEGAEDLEVWVVPSLTAGGPTWAPGRSRVAAYVPHRTLAVNPASTVASGDVYQMTFDSTTVPSGVAVSRLIADGVDWITALLVPFNQASAPAAAIAAALWAAVAVERGWPQDDQALPRANDMEKRLDTLLAALKTANTEANTQAGVTYPTAVLPQWSFPPADRRWDHPDYF